ncbi:sodium:proton antiporter [Alkalispirochaeta sphaeroplastigenens]|uniref:Sodium:proton antiporter n=1 Tax=Alkalispirochaeta sphaeroplastigenens TaxID=1187066 RepID=A0A2S4JP93_9SPIO|nr:SLC13 family permease [Alkalispirochaeta sphaeroplastigenens]POR01293.1 sodium:proton antiporter [Alkalispirochaeta sphaeroplastigenens]
MLTNPVFLSVLIMVALCLLKLNVLLSLVVSALAGGILAGMSLTGTMSTLIGGMGGNSSTALSYILLGALAASLHKTGIARILTGKIVRAVRGKATIMLLIIAGVACLSQNLIPVHIAFIPILVPPLLAVMNKLSIDRRAVAAALTFGLKAPYVALPVGYGWIFHGIISDQMAENGLAVEQGQIWHVLWIAGAAMAAGLLVAIFVTYRKPRSYEMIELREDQDSSASDAPAAGDAPSLTPKHWVALAGALSALAIQVSPLGSLHIGALVGLAIMLLGRAIEWSDIDEMIHSGIGMMGFIAFVMLIAAGYGAVIRETGAVEPLVESARVLLGGSRFMGATVMILIGLFITMGLGTSFGTIPIIAAIYVPMALSLGFSTPATILLIGVAGALGDAGSPASDSTLGPTAGLNVDGQHDHIWDTCVPTFLHYNIPLIVAGIIGAVLL